MARQVCLSKLKDKLAAKKRDSQKGKKTFAQDEDAQNKQKAEENKKENPIVFEPTSEGEMTNKPRTWNDVEWHYSYKVTGRARHPSKCRTKSPLFIIVVIIVIFCPLFAAFLCVPKEGEWKSFRMQYWSIRDYS